MPKFIKLAGADTTGNSRYVNVDLVTYVEGNQDGTLLLLGSKDIFKTKETPEQIMEMINDKFL